MKHLLLAFLFVLTIQCSRADDETTVMELPWNSPYALKVPGAAMTLSSDGSILTFSIPPSEQSSTSYFRSSYNIFRIPNPKITTRTYTLTGEVAYQNLGGNTGGGSIGMGASYRESGLIGTNTSDPAGLAARLDGTSDFRPFAITLRHSTSDKLEQLEIAVTLAGAPLPYGVKPADFPQSVSLRNLKLVEYPDPPPPPPPAPVLVSKTASAPTPVIAPSPGLDWPSFWIGVTASVVLLLALAQVLLLVRRANQGRKDKEMRRIASLDR